MPTICPSCAPPRRHCDPWRFPFSAGQFLSIIGGKGTSRIPEDGWDATTFAEHGEWLMVTQTRIGKLVQRKAVPHVAKLANKILAGQTERIISKVENTFAVDIFFPQHAELWRQAIQEVFDETGLQVTTELVAPIQSVMSQGYSKTSQLLAQEPLPTANAMLARKAQGIAQKITRINDTTRNLFERNIALAIDQGMTVTETAAQLRATIPGINVNRSMTIARTELSQAWTMGSAESFKESETLTHVSTIGCEAEEPTSPQYNGRSTCNYPDLPITELDAFMATGYHPNHTGVMVASAFRD